MGCRVYERCAKRVDAAEVANCELQPGRSNRILSYFCKFVFVLQVKAVFPGHGLEMVAQVYSSPDLGCLVVELTRRAGDAFKFSELREDLAKQLGPIISGAADVKAIASKCVHRVTMACFDPNAWTLSI